MHKGESALTPKERLTHHDHDEASILRVILADDPDFQAKSRPIAAAPANQRRRLAEVIARDYAPKRSAGHELIVELLLFMAEEPWRQKGAPRIDFFANLSRPAFWADSPLDELDGRRVRPRWATLEDGAHALALFGAGKCLNCEKKLAGDRYERGASGKRSRRLHCDACKTKERRTLLASQVDAKRQALDAATGQRRRYRSARRLV